MTQTWKRQPNYRPFRRAAKTLGAALALAPGLGFLASVEARADNPEGNSIVSTPIASEMAAYLGQRMSLASLLNLGRANGLLGTASLTTLNFGTGEGYSLSGLGGTEAAGLATHGIGLFYYNSGSGLASGLNDLMPSVTAYGMVDHLSLLGGASPKTGSVPAAVNAHGGSLSLDGEMYLSNASLAPSGMPSNGIAQPNAGGTTNQAYDQRLAFSARDITITGSLAQIGKNFTDGGSFASALASSDQATRDSANSLLNRRGQDEQTLGFSLGAARQMGQFSYSQDNLTDSVNNRKTGLQTLGYTWGDLSKTQFSFLSSDSRDLIGHTHNSSQTFALSQAFGKLGALQMSHAVQSQGASNASTVTTDNLHMTLSPDKRLALGADIAEKVTHDSFGGSDQAMSVNVKRSFGGLALGLIYGDEQRKSIASLGAAATPASIRTLGYSVTKQISKMFSVDTTWQKVDDSSQDKAHRHLATEATHFNFTPFKAFNLLDQYTTSNGIDNRLMSANYALPPKSLAGLGFGTATLSASETQVNGINCAMNQASTETQKLSLDTTLACHCGLAGMLLPGFLGTDTTLHLDYGSARIDSFTNSSGQLSHGVDADVQALKVGGSLARWKTAHWSYGYAIQTPTSAAAAKLPDAHEFDFTAPLSKLTMIVYDHDQIDQGGGNYKHGTDRHLSLGGALTSALNLTFDTGESRDYTLANPSHTRMMGVHLSGKHGALQNLDFKLQRQLESEVNKGRNNQTIYGLNFNIPQTTTRRLSLNCAVTDNKYIDRPASTGKMTATVGFDFAQQF